MFIALFRAIINNNNNTTNTNNNNNNNNNNSNEIPTAICPCFGVKLLNRAIFGTDLPIAGSRKSKTSCYLFYNLSVVRSLNEVSAITVFPLSVRSGIIGNSAIGMHDPKNKDAVVGILLLSCLEAAFF